MTHTAERTERVLNHFLDRASLQAPPRLAQALSYAVFPAGGRVRPELCLAVARACGERWSYVSDGAAAAVELMHCGSLVHDDLPSFDNADMRRGKPSVHRAFGEELAVLAGDGLIILAFEVLAESCAGHPELAGPMVSALGRASGSPFGIVAGQAWESEEHCNLDAYHSAKTAALFEAAAVMGALSAGADAAPWRTFGMQVGKLYQAADDIADALGSSSSLGKPVGQDELLDRPSLVRRMGIAGAIAHLDTLYVQAVGSLPECADPEAPLGVIKDLFLRLVPTHTTARMEYAPSVSGGL